VARHAGDTDVFVPAPVVVFGGSVGGGGPDDLGKCIGHDPKSVRTLRLHAALLREPGRAHRLQHLRNERGEEQSGTDRSRRGHDLDGDAHPVHGSPERVHAQEMGCSAGDDEEAESDEDALKGELPAAPPDEVDQGGGNRHVRQSDQDVGGDVRPEQFGFTSDTVPVASEELVQRTLLP
jgi:hypothetical protein